MLDQAFWIYSISAALSSLASFILKKRSMPITHCYIGTNGVGEEAISGPFRRVAYLLDHGES